MRYSLARSAPKFGAVFFITAILSVLLTPAAQAGADPITFQSSSTGDNADSARSITIDTPADVAEGDLMLAQISWENGDHVAVTPPDGWILVIRNDRTDKLGQAIYYKAATASEPATYTWALSRDKKAAGGILVYDNVDVATPVMAAAGAVGSDNSALNAPTVPDQSGPFLVSYFSVKKETSLSEPTGMTERYERQNTVGNQPSVSANDQADPGEDEARTSTAGTAGYWVAQSVLLVPFLDDDGDGAGDATDNCLGLSNPDQANHDDDPQGDACDDDDDNDGQSDVDETACGSDPIDGQSVSPDTDGDNTPNCLESDDDNDGQVDDDETACGSDPNDDQSMALDTDGDDIPNCVDDDDDDDGFTDADEAETGGGNNQGSDPLESGSVPEVCDDTLDNDGNEGVDEGCDSPPEKIFVDSSVTMAGAGHPFTGDIDSPRQKCGRNRKVLVLQKAPGPDELVGETKSEKDFSWHKWVGKNLDGHFYAKIPRKRYEMQNGTKVVCKANRSRPPINL